MSTEGEGAVASSAPDLPGDAAAEKDYGCAHYKCRCAYVSPCCKKVYMCRLCHNENENHEINRFEVTKIVCTECKEEQNVQRRCQKCGVEFGKYFCALCRLFDDTDKKQFHCDKCGICRIDGREKFFHCEKCDMCLGISLRDDHRCVEKVTRSNCSVCMEDLHTSRETLAVLTCGHMLHKSCYKGMLKTGNYTCPLCCQSIGDMTDVWHMLDKEIEDTPMPEEYRDQKSWILCKDCHKKSEAPFHVIGLKCQSCGSYNTCDTSAPQS